MTAMTLGERLTLAAALCEKAREDLHGFVLVGIMEEGNVLVSTARGSAVIIGELSEVITYLGKALADGYDIQAEMVAEANPPGKGPDFPSVSDLGGERFAD